MPAEGPRWGGKVDLAKVTLGVRVVPPPRHGVPQCTHANNIPDCLAEPSGRFSDKKTTDGRVEYTPGKSASVDAAASPMRA